VCRLRKRSYLGLVRNMTNVNADANRMVANPLATTNEKGTATLSAIFSVTRLCFGFYYNTLC
jgi:hypothetical protein